LTPVVPDVCKSSFQWTVQFDFMYDGIYFRYVHLSTVFTNKKAIIFPNTSENWEITL